MGQQAMSPALHVVPEAQPAAGTTVKLTFPGRRYHATPWGHHVNEGLIEWPPSPWRVLRALLATGYAKFHWPAGGPPTEAVTLIEKLASVLPTYRLPSAVGTHSRHYMPMARFDKGREQTTLVLDTWAHIDEDWLGIHWDVELSEEESALLGQLVQELGYLGRSESWVEGTLVPEQTLDEFFVAPGEKRPGPGWEQVALLAPERPGLYEPWREVNLSRDRAKLPTENAKGKALTKAQLAKQNEKLESAYPKDLIACLQVDTRWLQELGWSQPPGTRKVYYWRPTDALGSSPALTRRRPELNSQAEFILLALAPESNNRGNLPSVTRSLPQGELLHRAILSKYPDGNIPSVFSGRDGSGTPLRTEVAHRHMHILHLDLDDDQHLDHVLLWAPMGFDSDAQAAVRKVRHEVAKKAKRPHRVAVAAMGGRSDMLQIKPGVDAQLIERLQNLMGGKTGSKEWVSITPFVPPRFLKRAGKNSLEGQIQAELAARGLPEAVNIEILKPNQATSDDAELARKGRHFVRRRSRAGAAPPVDCGFMVRLTFAGPVQGPVVLGYGCHFGLGMMVGGEA